MQRRIRWLTAAGAVATALLVLGFAPLLTYRSVASPDGAFVAVARHSLAATLVPAMPGQGGDKPGRITLMRTGGSACGSLDVPMVSMVGEIIWDVGASPRLARIGWWALWDLDRCTLRGGAQQAGSQAVSCFALARLAVGFRL